MAEDGNGFNCENSYSKNQTSTSEERQRASKEANHEWATLKRRKAPRGIPKLKRWSVSEASSSKSRKTNATIAESASKELESLAVHMPNVPESDARALVLLRGVQRNVSH